jgi:hypothetical protein
MPRAGGDPLMPLTNFATYRQVLLDLGFQDVFVPSSFARLEHADTDTVVLLRPYADTDLVEPIIMLGYRQILDEKGVVSTEELDDLLRQRIAAG